ncbi:hypothetical protein O4H66_26650 [Comamonadaceae bacterium G21597-S1]|nr:hypothetical protein [Comamonadaceae bacterium G21597-S1]
MLVLLVRSDVQSNWLQGEVHAIVDHTFADIHRELGAPDNWCDVVSLHPNTKYCHVTTGPTGIQLQVRIGMSGPQKIDDAVLVSLRHRVAASMPGYEQLELLSRDGPMGTSDYRISLEALALPNARTLLHLRYSYTFNGIARLAMQAYRLQAWYDAAQRYPRQLHELERDAYLQMKRDEIRRQQALADNADAR